MKDAVIAALAACAYLAAGAAVSSWCRRAMSGDPQDVAQFRESQGAWYRLIAMWPAVLAGMAVERLQGRP